MERGLLTRDDDPTHKQKAVYSLTEMAIDLVPLFAHMGAWGRKHLPVSEELLDPGASCWKRAAEALEDFMEELRATHLGKVLPPGTPSVLGPTEAYLDVVEREKSA